MNKKLVLRFAGDNAGVQFKKSKTINNIHEAATDDGLVKLSKAIKRIVGLDLSEALKVSTENLTIA